MKKLVIALFFVGFSSNAYAGTPAVKIPPLKLCMNNSTGAIIAKKSCKFGETTITGSSLQALSSAGPQGPQGPAGPAGPSNVPGPVDPEYCTVRTNDYATDSIGASITVNCASNEFLMTHGVQTDDVSAFVNQSELRTNDGVKFPQGVKYYMLRDVGGATFNSTVSAVCCKFKN